MKFKVLFLSLLVASLLRADDKPELPSDPFPAEHYQSLWTKSPFAVASPEAGQESSDYALVGVARFDGIDYASLINKQTNEHLLLASDKPLPGLSLVSLQHGNKTEDISAVILNHGQSLTLKLETTAPNPPGNTAANAPPQPQNPNYPTYAPTQNQPPVPFNPAFRNPQQTQPATPPNYATYPPAGYPQNPASAPPRPAFHRIIIRVPNTPPSQ